MAARVAKLALATATCGALLAAQAPAAPTWLPATTLAGPLPTKVIGVDHFASTSPGPAAGFDADGDLFVAFRQWDGTHYRVGVVQRLRDGTTRTQTLGTATSDVDPGSVVLAVSESGDAIVAWTENAGMVFSAIGHAGQDLAATGLIGTAATFADGALLDVKAGDAGDLAVVFESATPGLILVARRAPGGTLGGATAIPGSLASIAFAAITPGGETVVAWTKQTTAATGRITDEVDVSTAPRAGTFGLGAAIAGTVGPAPTADNEERGGQIRTLAVDAAGTVHALVTVSDRFGMNATGDLHVALRPAGGAFGAVTAIAGTTTSTFGGGIPGQLWTDHAGDELIEVFNGATFVGRAYTRRPGGGFAPGDPMLGGDTVSGSSIATMGPSGAAGSLYRSAAGTGVEVFRAVGFDGIVGPAVTLATGEHLIVLRGALAFDDEGDGAAVWPDFDSGSGTESVRLAPFDGAGPRLSGLTVPATGAPGAPLAFSATASDTFSGVASIAWSFGDGSAAATGSPVTHAYSAAGTYTVTATATDTLGNTGTPLTGIVAVAPPAPMPGGDTKAPRVTKLSVSPKTFAAGSSARARAAAKRKRHRTPRGTTIRFTLSEDAKVTLTAVGKAVRHCRRVRGHKHCTTGKAPRYAVAGRRSFEKGADRLAFSGRVKGKALKHGSYKLEAIATDAAHNRGKTATTTFTVASG